MAAEYMAVKDDGSWKTVKAPWVKDPTIAAHQTGTPANDGWRKVHKVWVKNSGTWKVGHITRIANYTTLATNTYTSNGSITINAGVRWIQVTITGHGGAGGGAAGALPHYECVDYSPSVPQWQPSGYHWHSSQGGTGGTGGKVNAIFEVREGGSYSWAVPGIPTGGNARNETMSNSGTASHSATDEWTADTGGTANITFSTGDPNGSTNITMSATGGSGGAGGRIYVDRKCFNFGGTLGYTLSNYFGSTGANNSGSVTAHTGSLYGSYVQSGTGKAGGAGGTSGSSSTPGLQGSSPSESGFVEIIQYGIN